MGSALSYFSAFLQPSVGSSQSAVALTVGQQTIGNVKAESGSNVQVGIFWNPGDEDRERRGLIKWLAPWLLENHPESQWQILRHHRESWQEGTGTWLTENLLPQWQGGPNRHLWIYGKVGCGKSVLCSSVIRALGNDSLGDPNDLARIFAFSAFNLESSHQPDFIVRTILGRLCKLDNVFQELRKYQTQVLHDDCGKKGDMFALLKSVVNSLDNASRGSDKMPMTVYLVFDGVDEITTLQARTRSLRQIDRLCLLNDQCCTVRFRIILFSREDDQVRKHCKVQDSWHHHVIDDRQVKPDVRRALRGRIEDHDKMKRLDTSQKEVIVDRLSKRSDGMFRLASLHMGELEKLNLTDMPLEHLEWILGELPTGIYATYDRIIRRIESDQLRPLLFSALNMVLFAAGPLLVEDVVEASAYLYIWRSRVKPERRLFVQAADLADHLSGLLRIQPQHPSPGSPEPTKLRFTFEHYSVAEYLQHVDAEQWRIDANQTRPKDVQLSLTHMCLVYASRQIAPQITELEGSPLVSYAREYWSHHAAAYMSYESGKREQDIWTGERLKATIGRGRGLTVPLALALELQNAVTPGHCGSPGREQLRVTIAAMARDCGIEHDHSISEFFKTLAEPQWTSYLKVYRHLDMYQGAFRICGLKPGTSNERIRLELYETTLGSCPQFTYLSFRRRDSHDLQTILVNGHPVKINRTGHQALLHLRRRSATLFLWVDTVCVNPNDYTDRHLQHGLIPQIVQRAADTILWAGASFPRAHALVGVRDKGVALPRNASERATLTSAADELMKRTVWRRVETCLVVAFASELTIQIGSIALAWSSLAPIMRDCLDDPAQVAAFERTVRLRAVANEAAGLPEVLYLCQDCRCTDPRNKIFALQRIAVAEGDRSNIVLPDYNMEAKEVFTEAAIVILRTLQNLDILSIQRQQSTWLTDEWKGYPSWLPDWTLRLNDRSIAPGAFIPKRLREFNASRGGEFSFEVELPGRLKVRGFVMDVVSCTTHEHTLPDGTRLPPDWPTCGKSFFRTRDGRLGNGTDELAEGDCIAILFGGATPYAIRPPAPDHDSSDYGFVGECYVEGVMHGEAMENFDQQHADWIALV